MDRRSFLREGLKTYVIDLMSCFDIDNLLKDLEPEKKDYFASLSSCYPLLSEAPYEQLVEAARQLGINPENKNKLELAREVFAERR
jgi:hypothetical protein